MVQISPGVTDIRQRRLYLFSTFFWVEQFGIDSAVSSRTANNTLVRCNFELLAIGHTAAADASGIFDQIRRALSVFELCCCTVGHEPPGLLIEDPWDVDGLMGALEIQALL